MGSLASVGKGFGAAINEDSVASSSSIGPDDSFRLLESRTSIGIPAGVPAGRHPTATSTHAESRGHGDRSTFDAQRGPSTTTKEEARGFVNIADLDITPRSPTASGSSLARETYDPSAKTIIKEMITQKQFGAPEQGL